MINRSRIFFTLLVIVGLLLLAFGGLYTYDQKRDPPLSYQNRPFPLKYKQVYPGEVVPLEVERCNSSDETLTYHTTHNMRNVKTGVVTMLPDGKTEIEPGCHRGNSRLNVVPGAQPAGMYTSFGTAQIKMLFGTREIKWNSEPYEVLPPKPIIAPVILVPVPVPGPAGPAGKVGATGKAGATGSTGATGAKGETGKFWGGK